MSPLDFVASLASSLAWPIAVVLLATVFRAPLAGILEAIQRRIPHIRRATGPGNTSFEFEQVAEEADAAALELPEQPAPEPRGRDATEPSIPEELQLPLFRDKERREELALLSPTAAFLATYAELELQIRNFFSETGPGRASKHRMRYTIRLMAEELTRQEHLPTGFPEVLRPLVVARNALAHGEIPEDQDRAELRTLVRHSADLALIVSRHRRAYRVESGQPSNVPELEE